MSYTKTTWINNDLSSPVDADNLNKIENGIGAVTDIADNTVIEVSLLTGRVNDLDGVGGDIDQINDAIVDLDEEKVWRNIDVDPVGDVVADGVDKIFVSWAGAVSVLLPPVPTLSDSIRICDAGCDFSTYNLTIKGNSKNIMGAATDYVLVTLSEGVELSWSGDTYGWAITART